MRFTVNLMTEAEVRDFLRISRSSMRRILKQGNSLPRIQISDRRFMFDRADVEAFLASKPKGFFNTLKLEQPPRKAA